MNNESEDKFMKLCLQQSLGRIAIAKKWSIKACLSLEKDRIQEKTNSVLFSSFPLSWR